MKKYRCIVCQENKPKEEFGLFDEGNFRCKDCVEVLIEKYNHGNRKNKTQKKRISRQAIRMELVKALGSRCSNCGMNDIRCLQVDHIHGKGAQEIKEKGYYKMYLDALHEVENGDFGNYQLLCANCNWIKRHTNGEIAKSRPILT